MSWKKTFYEGLKSGIPLDWVSAGLLYVWLPGGVGWSAGLGSSFYIADELNERGQFAGTNLILAGAGVL